MLQSSLQHKTIQTFSVDFRQRKIYDITYIEHYKKDVIILKHICKKAVALSIVVLMLTTLLTGCQKSEKSSITTLAQLNDSAYTIGIAQGAACQSVVEKELPKTKRKYFAKNEDAYLAVQQGKIDAYIYDQVMIEFAIAKGLTDVKLLSEKIGEPYDVAVGISPKTSIPNFKEDLNKFIAEMRENGTIDDMYNRWVVKGSEDMPDIEKPKSPTRTIKVGTTGTYQPFSYYKDNELCGYDIELINRFALWMNAKVEIEVYDYDGIVSAAQSGSIDCIIANLFVTEERKESIDFSDNIYQSYNAIIVRDNASSGSANGRAVVETARIGVMDGSTNEIYAEKHYPNADRQNFKNYVDSCAALSANKLDYAMMDYTNALRFTRSNPDLEIASDFLTDEKLCIGVSKSNPELYEKVNEVMDRFLADGTVDAAIDHWIKPDGSEYDVVETPKLPNAPKIKVAIVSSREPTTFMMNGEFVGLDVEIIDRILYELGYQADYSDMEWGSVIAAIESGKAEITLGMYNTPERAEKLFFTEPYFTNPQLLVARKLASSADQGEYTSLAQLNGKIVSAVSGSVFDQYVIKEIPDAKMSYFNNVSDELRALKNKKIDGFVVDKPVAEYIMAQNPDITVVPELLAHDEYGMTLLKDNSLTEEFNSEIAKLKADGTLDKLFKKWAGADESVKTLPSVDYPAPNGTMRIACCIALEPMCYADSEGVPRGFEVELAMMVAEKLGMKPELISMEFAGLMPMVQSGKADVALGCMSITDERKQTVDMTDSYYDGGMTIMVRKATVDTTNPGFFANLKQSFIRTFITENRWKLVLDGLFVTMVLSLCSGALGSVIGFAICMLRRNKRKIVSVPTAIFIRIIQGTPIVVLLMILYYIIFGQVDISALLVAILGFGVNFGVYVSEMLRTGIDAVDKGQIEAAHALGFTKIRTFWKVTFPQAARHFLPVFKGEFISMVKMTSVVGYIAIQDLTKVSDIIRSRTLEAFFPLIAIAVLYFIAANVLTMLLTSLEVRLDRNRGKKSLKGVVKK